MDQLSDYDYLLPQELIATRPHRHREAARLLVIDRQKGTFKHKIVSDLPDGDLPFNSIVNGSPEAPLKGALRSGGDAAPVPKGSDLRRFARP